MTPVSSSTPDEQAEEWQYGVRWHDGFRIGQHVLDRHRAVQGPRARVSNTGLTTRIVDALAAPEGTEQP